jgi:xanthine phosphoribosyltransferase
VAVFDLFFGGVMKLLEEKIATEGRVLGEDILKVDGFLNHQIDPALMQALGEEFVRVFGDEKIDKVLTVETSGIAPALMTALKLNVPLVFAKKKAPSTFDGDSYMADVFSFTKQETNSIRVAKQFLTAGERVLLIDDFLANGEAVKGMVNIAQQAGVGVVGIGIVIEKAFQGGRKTFVDQGYRVESLAKISHFEDGKVYFDS